jgi:hypothetical protein
MRVCVQCGAVGLNLQSASVVYLMSADWNPCKEIQAIARAHRKGQRRAVEAVVIIPVDKNDRCIDAIVQKKQADKLNKLRFVEGGAKGGADQHPHTGRLDTAVLEDAEVEYRKNEKKRRLQQQQNDDDDDGSEPGRAEVCVAEHRLE